jgi:hypothetical protein
MCFFFSALIDQAVHSSLREEHSFFDHLARYPKFVGILSSYRSNLHPTWLLLAATLYADPRDATVATRDFEQLTDYFVQDYVNFFQVQYPQVTGRLKCPADRILAIRQVLGDIVQALEPREVVLSLGPSTQRTPDLRLYRHWVSYCRDGMQQKLNEVTHIGDISTGGGAETPPPVT